MIKSLIVPVLLSLTLLSQAEAACLKDHRGEVICGAGACARDRSGEVYCAQLRFGSVLRTRDGLIVCGRGQCTTNRRGDYVCSDVEGGSVVKQLDGTVRCAGTCEDASAERCERVPAGR